MCLSCQSNTFPFPKQSNSSLSLLNSPFHNFKFSCETSIFPGEYLKSFFTEFNSIDPPFNDSDHHDVNYFNKLKINENYCSSTLHLNIISLSHYFEDLHNFLFLLKHTFYIIVVSEYKISN